MKKLAIVLIMAVILGLSQVSRIGRVNAELSVRANHISGEWTIETDGDYYAYFYGNIVSGYSTGWSFIIPAYPEAYPYDITSIATGSEVELYDGLDLLYTYPLSDFVDFTELYEPLTEFFVGYTIRVTLGTLGGIEEVGGYGTAYDLDLGDCNAIKVKVYQSFASIPSVEGVTWINAWETLATIYEYDLGMWVYYHSLLGLYDTDFTVFSMGPPADPTPPTDYVFRAWKTDTGEVFDFDAGVTDPSWLSQDEDGYDYLNLWASFVNVYDPSIEYPLDPTDNSPTGFLDILDAFGLDDDGGKMIVFYVIALVAVFGLLAIKPIRENPFVIIIVLVALTTLFMFLGWLPVWSSVITFLILTYAGLKTLGMTPTTSRED